jgi:hypothetical protein
MERAVHVPTVTAIEPSPNLVQGVALGDNVQVGTIRRLQTRSNVAH